MNDDKAMNGERIAYTSNRNFQGPQGQNRRPSPLDFEPQFRRPPRQERQDPANGPGNGRRRRHHRPPRRRAAIGMRRPPKRPSVLRDAPAALLSMRAIALGIKKMPHPEEAASGRLEGRT